MANTFFLLAGLIAALFCSVEAAGNPVYLVSYGSNPYYRKPGSFCQAWRGKSVAYAGQSCHHHVISCKDLGRGRAQVFSGWVTFNNPNGCHPETGPKRMKPVDDTRIVAGMARATLLGRVSKRDIVEGDDLAHMEKRAAAHGKGLRHGGKPVPKNRPSHHHGVTPNRPSHHHGVVPNRPSHHHTPKPAPKKPHHHE